MFAGFPKENIVIAEFEPPAFYYFFPALMGTENKVGAVFVLTMVLAVFRELDYFFVLAHW